MSLNYARLNSRIIEFATIEHRLPGKPIFVQIDGLLEIVDGSHRLATYLEMKRKGVSESTVFSQVTRGLGEQIMANKGLQAKCEVAASDALPAALRAIRRYSGVLCDEKAVKPVWTTSAAAVIPAMAGKIAQNISD